MPVEVPLTAPPRVRVDRDLLRDVFFTEICTCGQSGWKSMLPINKNIKFIRIFIFFPGIINAPINFTDSSL